MKTGHASAAPAPASHAKPKQQGEVHQGLMRLSDAINQLEARVNSLMPKLAIVQRGVPTNGKQTKCDDCGVSLANRINESCDRVTRLVGILSDNEEILDL